ncbi:DUF6527 family protein [Phyllobacterium sp. SB3]|uniref:DUF6527 family protein n=1 Tax=Phyllobacterium sp. SB3 TaxID=3156073 RepID=UPI0032AEC055
MTRVDRLITVFVDDIPEHLEDGFLYVSRECHVALHNCACGCGEEVSSPLVPTEYTLVMEDEGASIWPSIGNHDFTCGSHYIIERGRIRWAGKMSRAQIEAGRAHDRLLKRGVPPKGIKAVIAWFKRLWIKFTG